MKVIRVMTTRIHMVRLIKAMTMLDGKLILEQIPPPFLGEIVASSVIVIVVDLEHDTRAQSDHDHGDEMVFKKILKDLMSICVENA